MGFEAALALDSPDLGSRIRMTPDDWILNRVSTFLITGWRRWRRRRRRVRRGHAMRPERELDLREENQTLVPHSGRYASERREAASDRRPERRV